MGVHRLRVSVALFALALALGVAHSSGGAAAASEVAPDQIQGKAFRLERAYLVVVHAPVKDVANVLKSVAAAVGLEYGKYDHVAYIDEAGIEQFRPIEGSKAGVHQELSRQPTKVVSFSVPHDSVVLQKALEAVYAAHSYEEPVIYVSEVWRTRSTNPDEQNPNRWWNQKPK
jgi:hypothetical protein